MALRTLKKRAEFLRIRGGHRVATRAFVVEAKPRVADSTVAAPANLASTAAAGATTSNAVRGPGHEQTQPLTTDDARFGVTVTKKLGGAVTRNRIKRRLREAVRAACKTAPLQGHDVVIVARSDALTISFSELVAGLVRAFGDIAAGRAAPKRGHRRRTPSGRQRP